MAGMRDTLLGKATGRTGWQKIKSGWQASKDREAWQRKFHKAYNPLSLGHGDLVEIGFTDRESFEVQTILWFQTPAGEPDYVRYALKHMGSGELSLLEVIPDGSDGELIHALFELVDEFELDERLIEMMEKEDTLRQTVEDADGKEVVLDYQKDFVVEAQVELFDKETARTLELLTVNYCIEQTDGQEAYLAVEVNDTEEWMSFYRGKRIKETDITSYGSVAAG
jgi:hypothetical protein